jgi:hypothetical protein
MLNLKIVRGPLKDAENKTVLFCFDRYPDPLRRF